MPSDAICKYTSVRIFATFRIVLSVSSLNSKHSNLRLLIVCWPRALSRLFKLASFIKKNTVSGLVIMSSSCSRSRLFRLVSESVPMLAIHRLEKARDEDTITNRETVSFLWKLASLNRLERAQNRHTITNRKYACSHCVNWKTRARSICVWFARCDANVFRNEWRHLQEIDSGWRCVFQSTQRMENTSFPNCFSFLGMQHFNGFFLAGDTNLTAS